MIKEIYIKHGKLIKVFSLDVISKGADFLLLPMYLKLMTQEEYGSYTYIILILISISGILRLGIDTTISKLYYEVPEINRGEMLFSTNLIWAIILGLITLISFFTGIDRILFETLFEKMKFDYSSIRLSILLLILFNILNTVLNVYYVISDKIFKYQVTNFFKTIVVNTVILLSLYYSNHNKVITRLFLEPILSLVIFSPIILSFIKIFKVKFKKEYLKKSMKIGLPLTGVLIISMIYNFSDKYFLQKFSALSNLGVYNLAIFLTTPISLIFISYHTLFLPKFFKEKDDIIRKKKVLLALKQLSIVFFVLFPLIWIALFLALRYNFINKEYYLILSLLPIIYLSKVLDNYCQLLNDFIIAWEKTVISLILTVILCMLTFSLSYKFIALYGLFAAASILLFTSICKFAYLSIYVHKSLLKIQSTK